MSKNYISEKFVDFFKKNREILDSLCFEYAEKYPDLGKYFKLFDSNTYDPETERLMQSFCFMLSRLDLNIDHQSCIEERTNFLGLYPELMRILPAYAMVQFFVKPDLFEKESNLGIYKENVFSIKNQYEKIFKFKSMCHKKFLFHVIESVRYLNRFSPHCHQNFSHIEINLNLNLKDSKKIVFYVNASLENAFHIMDQIANKNLRCYAFINNRKIQINKDYLCCEFDFEHYLNLKSSNNNIYCLFDFFNYIKKHLFFSIDLTKYTFTENNLKIVIETANMDEDFEKNFKENILCLNVFPLINIFYEKRLIYSLDKNEEKNIFSLEENHNKKEELIGVASVSIEEKRSQEILKMFSLNDYCTKKNRPDTSKQFSWTELGWNFDRTKFDFQIVIVDPDVKVEEDMFKITPHFIYSEGLSANELSQGAMVDKKFMSKMSHIEQVEFLNFNPSFSSLFDSKPEWRATNKDLSIENLAEELIFENRDWVLFLNKMLDSLCQDTTNKLVFRKALDSLVWEKHELYRDHRTCPMTEIKIVKKDKKYNGGIYLFEFLLKYISLVNVMELETTAKIL